MVRVTCCSIAPRKGCWGSAGAQSSPSLAQAGELRLFRRMRAARNAV